MGKYGTLVGKSLIAVVASGVVDTSGILVSFFLVITGSVQVSLLICDTLSR